MKTNQKGFTLIELLVVIAIIAILAAILFPVFARAREKARQTTCTSNQRQIVAAVQMYAQDHEESFPTSGSFWSSINVDPGVKKCPSADKSIPVSYSFVYALADTSIGKLDDPTTSAVTVDAQSTMFPNILVDPSEIQMRHSGQAIVGYADGHVGAIKDQYALFPTPVVGEIRGIDDGSKITLVYNPANPATNVAAANLNTLNPALVTITTAVLRPAIGTYGVALLGTGAAAPVTCDETTVQAPFNPIKFNTGNWTQVYKLTGTWPHFVLNNGTTDQTGFAYTTSNQSSIFEKLMLSTSDYKPYIATIVVSKVTHNSSAFQIGFSSNPACVGVAGMVTRGNGCKFGEPGSENTSLYRCYSYIYQITSPGCPVYVYLRRNGLSDAKERVWGITGIFYDKI